MRRTEGARGAGQPERCPGGVQAPGLLPLYIAPVTKFFVDVLVLFPLGLLILFSTYADSEPTPGCGGLLPAPPAPGLSPHRGSLLACGLIGGKGDVNFLGVVPDVGRSS